MEIAVKMFTKNQFDKYYNNIETLLKKQRMDTTYLNKCHLHWVMVVREKHPSKIKERIIGHVGLEWCTQTQTWHLQSLIIDGQRQPRAKRRNLPINENPTYKYRYHGLGGLLVNKVLNFLEEQESYAPIFVATMAKNAKFFENLGFTRVNAAAAKEESPILGRPKHKYHTVFMKG